MQWDATRGGNSPISDEYMENLIPQLVPGNVDIVREITCMHTCIAKRSARSNTKVLKFNIDIPVTFNLQAHPSRQEKL